MPEFTPETLKWLANQGPIAVVLLLVLIDYKRTYQRLITKLEEDKGALLAVVKDNTESNTELRASVERWARVTEDAFPRGGGRRVSDHLPS